MSNDPLDEEAVFKAACKIASADARDAYLKQVVADPALLARLQALLRVYDQEPGFLEDPWQALPGAAAVTPRLEHAGDVLGRYRLLEEIGEGGMGVVYRAEQQTPVRRLVALKVLKAGMDTRRIVARFETERQTLALMDHPNIVRVLDAGMTGEGNPKSEARNTKQIPSPKSEIQNDQGPAVSGIPASELDLVSSFELRVSDSSSGRPYFVMDLVEGLPLTDYCDRHRLDIAARLELFLQVCHAVQHAHTKGVIHRDLKPSHLIVAPGDAGPALKIIDFGIAKVVQGAWDEKSALTTQGQILGTPLYMSPEQTEAGGLDVDTRSDVYSLGVVLYELLSGQTPFATAPGKTPGYDEIRRRIREEEPTRPSAQITTTGEPSAAIAANRQTEPARLVRLLRRDLDWIVLRALEKDRLRRYQTAGDLAQEIERYLSHEPIEARPPTLADRVAKWTRRHRGFALGAVAFLGLTAAVLAVSIVLVSQQRNRARDNYDRAESERRRARANFESALAAVDEMVQGFDRGARREVPTPPLQRAGVVLYDKAAQLYQTFLRDDDSNPDVQQESGWAHLRLAAMRRSQSKEAEAEEHVRRAITLFEALAERGDAEIHRDLAQAYTQLGNILAAGRAARNTDGYPAYQTALAHWEAAAALEPGAASHRKAWASLLSEISRGVGDNARRSEPLCRTALEMQRRLIAEMPEDPEYGEDLAQSLENLARFTFDAGRTAEAVAIMQEELARREDLAARFPAFEPNRVNLISRYRDWACYLRDRAKRPAQAVTAFRKAIALFRQSFVERPNPVVENERVVSYLVDLSAIYAGLGQHDMAADVNREAAISLDKAVAAAPDDVELAKRAALGHMFLSDDVRAARPRDAETALRRSLALYHSCEGKKGAAGPEAIAEVLWRLAAVTADLHRPDEAESLMTRYVECAARPNARLDSRPAMANAYLQLAGALEHAGSGALAVKACREALRRLESIDTSPPTRWLTDGRCTWAPDVPDGTFSIYSQLAKSLARFRQIEELQKATGRMKTMVEETSKRPGGQGSRAAYAVRFSGIVWDLVRHPHPEANHARLAVALAEQACQWLPAERKNDLGAGVWSALGAARYRAADWKGALEAFRTADACNPGQCGFGGHDWLFRAMAHHRAGEKAESQELYRKAVAQLEKTYAGQIDPALRPLSDEAATLLGQSNPEVHAEDKK